MKSGGWIAPATFVIAWVVSRIAFAAAGFSYNVFSDPFNFGKLIIDLAVFGSLWGLGYYVLSRFWVSKKS
jgi:hypothetical protein